MLSALERDARRRHVEPARGRLLRVDRLRPGTDAGDLLGRATEQGVTFVRGTDFFPPGRGGETAARFAFSFETPERIAEGVATIAALL